MARVRQSYGIPLVRRANSMEGTAPEPMTMERLERKEFLVPEPQPVIIAMDKPIIPEVPSGEAEAAPEGLPPADAPDPDLVGTGMARTAADALIENTRRKRELLDEL